jgi:hypothetical protein
MVNVRIHSTLCMHVITLAAQIFTNVFNVYLRIFAEPKEQIPISNTDLQKESSREY